MGFYNLDQIFEVLQFSGHISTISFTVGRKHLNTKLFFIPISVTLLILLLFLFAMSWGIPLPSGGIVGKNRSTRRKTIVRNIYIKRPRLASKVWFSNGRNSNGLDHEPNILNPNRSKTEQKKVRISNGFGFRAFGIRAPTVFKCFVFKWSVFRFPLYNQVTSYCTYH